MAFRSCKSLLAFVLAALLAWATPALATSSLSFEGGGYWIDMEIGMDQIPVLASVRFHKPGDTQGIVLPRNHWQVETFDTQRRVLLLRHLGGDADVEPFTLTVRQDAAVLTVGEREIQSPFAWSE